MSLKDDLPELFAAMNRYEKQRCHNYTLFDIYEGNLLCYVLEDLARQMSKESFDQVKHRVAPINMLPRIMGKLSTVYSEPPSREVTSELDSDKELVKWYSDKTDINTVCSNYNEFFNLFKNSFIEPYVENGLPGLRTVPSDRFFVYSKDKVNPLRVTHYVKYMGCNYTQDGSEKKIYYVYTDEEFLIVDQAMNIQTDLMGQLENPGVNVYGAIPGVYVSKSRHDLISRMDTDLLSMIKLFPLLFSDMNFAIMFQSFAVIYGINVDITNARMSPNAIWEIKSDPGVDGNSSIGTIKPEVDVDKILSAVKSQLATWLNSKNIKPGAVGELTADNAASGVSKMIDEMDTTDDKRKQIPYFKTSEQELWDLIINHMHPVWSSYPEYQNKVQFSPGVEVVVTFQEPEPFIDENTIVDAEIKKLDKGLASQKSALMRLYPDMSESDIEEFQLEINQGKEVTVTQPEPMVMQ